MDVSESLEGWLACQHCDALLHRSQVAEGRSVICPHCGSVLFRHKRNAIARTLAFTIAGLLLYIPANFLPIMSFGLMGNGTHSSLFKGVLQLWKLDEPWIAVLVFLCSMALPLIELGSLFLLALASALRRFHRWHRPLLRSIHAIHEWGMLEVYLLGILVAFIKLSDLGDTHVNIASFCFVGLLACSMGAVLSFDVHRCWDMLDRARRSR